MFVAPSRLVRFVLQCFITFLTFARISMNRYLNICVVRRSKYLPVIVKMFEKMFCMLDPLAMSFSLIFASFWAVDLSDVHLYSIGYAFIRGNSVLV